MKSMTRFLTALVFAFIAFSASGQTPFYASYNWQRGQTFSDTVRFNDTIFTANDGNSTQWDSAYSVIQSGIDLEQVTNNGANTNVGITVTKASGGNFAGLTLQDGVETGVSSNRLSFTDVNSTQLGLVGYLFNTDDLFIQTYAGDIVIDVTNGDNFQIDGLSTSTETTALMSASTGVVSRRTLNIGNWDSAYAHKVNSIAFNTGDGVLTLTQQDAGTVTADLDGRYLTSYTETDPIFTASTAFGISDTDTTNWDSAYTAANNAINQLSSINPNSSSVADQFYNRSRDGLASNGYIEYYNQVNSDIGRLMNQTLSSGRTAFQDATIVYLPAVADTLFTRSIVPLDGTADIGFARASTATRVNYQGTIESVSNNIPRMDFSSDATEPSMLLEPARTNLLTYSEQFDNAAWTKSNVTISANATTAPDGTTTADKIVGDAVSGSKIAFQSVTVTSSTVYSCSVFFKADEYSLAYVRFGGVTGQPYVVYDLSTQSIDAESGFTSTNIVDYGNGWYRIDATATASGTSIALNVSFAPSGYTIGAFNALEYTGDGSSGGFVWGAQLEAGAYPTSYIPTTTATVTRAAEAASKTGLAAYLGDSEGTIFFEGIFSQDGRLSLSDATLNNRITVGVLGTNQYFLLAIVGGVSQGTVSGGTYTIGSTVKFALKYSLNDYSLWVNGAELLTDSTALTFADGVLTSIYFANGDGLSSNFYGNVKHLAIWDTALSDAELELLTTPISLN